MASQPDQVTGHTLQLCQQYAHILDLVVDLVLDAKQFLYVQRVAQIVTEGGHVIHAIGQYEGLVICFVLGSFLNASVQEANIRNSFDDYFTLNGQDEPQHAMGTGMLRSHIYGHGIDALPIWQGRVIARTVLDGIFVFYVLLLHMCPTFGADKSVMGAINRPLLPTLPLL